MLTATASRRIVSTNLKLSYQEGKGWFKHIGKTVGGNAKRFWLGQDQQQAEHASLALQHLWQGLGAAEWTDDALARAESIRLNARTSQFAPESPQSPIGGIGLAPMPSPFVRQPATPDRAIGACGKTLADSLDAYADEVRSNPLLSAVNRRGIVFQAKGIKGYFKGMTFDALTLKDLFAFVAHWASRPTVKTGERASIQYAINTIKAMRRFLQWVDDGEVAPLPRRWEKAFKLRYVPTLRKVEHEIVTYSLADLKTLYHAATDIQRLYILLALNCGFANVEIASLRLGEIHLDSPTPYIDRLRQKTGVRGKWILWAETATLLRQFMRKGDADTLALTTRFGKPLVWYSDKSRLDAIKLTWVRLCDKTGVGLSFKFLRKTGADWVRQFAGVETSETYLSHSDTTLAKLYSNRNFDKVGEALGAFRTYLQPLFTE